MPFVRWFAVRWPKRRREAASPMLGVVSRDPYMSNSPAKSETQTRTATNVSATGYLHPGYAAALAEFGEPLELPLCQGWRLRRAIADTPYHDAMGCYPLFTCRNWAELPNDLAALEGDLVSVAVVSDPFGNRNPVTLEAYFDRVVRFKEHFVVDLSAAPETFISKHHRYYARKALGELRVELRESRPAHRRMDELVRESDPTA